MRGLFTKIFLCFWIAQSLTFVISTVLILQHRFVRPDQGFDAFSAAFNGEASAAAIAYEQSGCAGLQSFASALHQAIYLSDESLHPLCGLADGALLPKVLSQPGTPSEMQSVEVGKRYLWSKRVVSATGEPYIFWMDRATLPRQGGLLRDLWHFASPQLPVTIVVFGASTFILVLMLTRPIARLRVAAGDLAKGKLSARVKETGGNAGLFGDDEIQQLVHDFNHMAERLESLMNAHQMLLRDVSHELRTPLTRLYVTLELAREDAPLSMTDHLDRIESEATRLTSLIEQLLRLSSMESANVPARSETFSFAKLLEDIVPNADFEARQRSCGVRLQGECTCNVEGVPALLYQAVENVVRNAIRYTREGSVVELNLRCESHSAQSMVVLEVCDDGPGISDEEKAKIFLPFYRIDGARQRDTGGFGIGLAIADRAVKLHHGEICVQNRAAGGLAVTMKIPCRKNKRLT
jgi:two-component system sensor histidine kinase CpxA